MDSNLRVPAEQIYTIFIAHILLIWILVKHEKFLNSFNVYIEDIVDINCPQLICTELLPGEEMKIWLDKVIHHDLYCLVVLLYLA